MNIIQSSWQAATYYTSALTQVARLNPVASIAIAFAVDASAAYSTRFRQQAKQESEARAFLTAFSAKIPKINAGSNHVPDNIQSFINSETEFQQAFKNPSSLYKTS